MQRDNCHDYEGCEMRGAEFDSACAVQFTGLSGAYDSEGNNSSGARYIGSFIL